MNEEINAALKAFRDLPGACTITLEGEEGEKWVAATYVFPKSPAKLPGRVKEKILNAKMHFGADLRSVIPGKPVNITFFKQNAEKGDVLSEVTMKYFGIEEEPWEDHEIYVRFFTPGANPVPTAPPDSFIGNQARKPTDDDDKVP